MESIQMAKRLRQAEEMLPLLRRHEIQVLLRAGHGQKDVAERTGVSIDTVRRVKIESEVTETDDAAERRARGIGRPSKAAPFAAKVRAWLVDTPDLPTQELLRRAKDAGYEGHKTAFYALVAGARPPRATPVVRFEGLPGEFSQHDFGQVDVTFVDGRKKRVHFFASRLKYSRFAAVTLVEDERVETIVRCLARDFVAFGGLPLMAVFDRPRTIVQEGRQRARRRVIQRYVRAGDRRHRRRRRDVRAPQRQSERIGRALGGLGEELVLQTSQIPGRYGPPCATRRLA
jgi:transposase